MGEARRDALRMDRDRAIARTPAYSPTVTSMRWRS